MEKEKCYATLMQRIVINANTFLFKPLSVLEGEYFEESETFADKYGKSYSDVTISHITFDDDTEYFAFPMTSGELKEMYDTKDIEKALTAYVSENEEYICFGIVDEHTGELDLIELNMEDLAKYSQEFTNVEANGDQAMVVDKNDFLEAHPELRIYLTEEMIDQILNTDKTEDIKKIFARIKDACHKIKSEEFFEDEEIDAELEEKTEVHEEASKEGEIPFDVNDMYNYVTSKVINQDEAVKKVIMNFALNKMALSLDKNQDLQPTRLLITGPTGVGKTLILETILEYLEKKNNSAIPMVKVPTSQLTVAGYVGMNLEDILEELVSKTPNLDSTQKRVEYAEKNGIVFFDEIDKKGSSQNGDVAGRGVLNSLLQFLDGSTYEIEVNRTRFYFNTKYLNIFASGAFTHVNDAVKKRTLGFNTPNFNKEEVLEKNSLTIEDYIKKGEMPSEFMGRFHQIVSLNELKVEDLVRILNESRISPIMTEKNKLTLAGIDLVWDEQFIEEIAKRAYNLKLGARSLKTIIEEALFDLKWEALIKGEKATVKVSKETVENSKQYKRV